MNKIADTPKPPYYLVVFSTIRNPVENGYAEMAEKMVELASQQKGFLGVESARNEIGITVSYWSDLESIKNWKANTDHLVAQERGKSEWYQEYKVRIAKVERDYGFM